MFHLASLPEFKRLEMPEYCNYMRDKSCWGLLDTETRIWSRCLVLSHHLLSIQTHPDFVDKAMLWNDTFERFLGAYVVPYSFVPMSLSFTIFIHVVELCESPHSTQYWYGWPSRRILFVDAICFEDRSIIVSITNRDVIRRPSFYSHFPRRWEVDFHYQAR